MYVDMNKVDLGIRLQELKHALDESRQEVDSLERKLAKARKKRDALYLELQTAGSAQQYVELED